MEKKTSAQHLRSSLSAYSRKEHHMTTNKLQVQFRQGAFQAIFDERTIFASSMDEPLAFLGEGKEDVRMYRGNYDIKDYVIQRIPLYVMKIEEISQGYEIYLGYTKDKEDMRIRLQEKTGRLHITFEQTQKGANRFWLRLHATKDEKIYGCGEQPSHFNLRGKNFPLWTSEPGVGRNKKTYTTWQADVKDLAGGDYYTTYYPEQTFISTKKYYLHVDSFAYADFDFRNDAFHELQWWEIPKEIILETADTYVSLVSKLTGLLGRQPMLPDWAFEGVILGVQGGTKRMLEMKERMEKAKVSLAGFFIQDWEGIRMTSFGKRLFWDWKWSSDVYPKLDKEIWNLKEEGIRVMGYINPYLCNDGSFYQEAKEKDYFAKTVDGDIYLVDFGEFYCGVVDFTNPEAFTWYKELIKTYMIDFGLDGWMADFGEYLPTDIVLYDGSDPMILHNKWPALWAQVNYEAVKEAGKLGEIVYFMRAGATGSQTYCTLMWAGDQSVIWELDDGLASVIPSVLSTAMVGCGLNHSDIGGYTSLHGNTRSEELFLRWCEMAAFAPFMRTHEGNRPGENYQIYDGNEAALAHFAKFTGMYKALAPYIKKLVQLNHEEGLPVQRPLFMHYEEDEKTYDIQYEFLLGEDILVAPVYEEGKTVWEVYLPKDEWIHIWSGKEYPGGTIEISAMIGEPPVFVRKDSEAAGILLSYVKA